MLCSLFVGKDLHCESCLYLELQDESLEICIFILFCFVCFFGKDVYILVYVYIYCCVFFNRGLQFFNSCKDEYCFHSLMCDIFIHPNPISICLVFFKTSNYIVQIKHSSCIKSLCSAQTAHNYGREPLHLSNLP